MSEENRQILLERKTRVVLFFDWMRKYEPLFMLLSLGIAVCALFFSLWANKLSRDANALSSKANTISEKANTLSKDANRISADANQLGRDANRTSENALILAKTNFLTQSRPYLNVVLKQVSDSQSFSVSVKENKVCIEVKFLLENKGRVPANMVSFDQSCRVEIGQGEGKFILAPKFEKTNIAIGPDQNREFISYIWITVPVKDNSVLLNRLLEDVKWGGPLLDRKQWS